MTSEGTKVCRRCKQEKPLSDFPTNNAMKDKKDGMCKPCWSDYQKEKRARAQERAALSGEQGTAVPKRTRKAAVKEGQEGEGAEEAPASSHFANTDPNAPENKVPTIITEEVDGEPIEVIHIPSGDNLDKKTWYRGLIGPLADVYKFFSDVFGRKPSKAYKFQNTWYFPLTDEERAEKGPGVK